MFRNTYQIAGITISIESIYEYVHNYCDDYGATGKSDIEIVSTLNDINREQEFSTKERRYENLPPYDYAPEEYECTSIYRKIGERLSEYDALIFHGSAIAVDGQGYLFAAKSGTGKSTHTRLWRELFGDRTVMINDDKPILRIVDGKVLVCGTPYNGKHRLGTNKIFPLKAMCIVTRSENNYIERIDKREAYPMLVQQTYRPEDRETLSATLSLIDRIAGSVELYQLHCNMDISAAQVAYDGMKG